MKMIPSNTAHCLSLIIICLLCEGTYEKKYTNSNEHSIRIRSVDGSRISPRHDPGQEATFQYDFDTNHQSPDKNSSNRQTQTNTGTTKPDPHDNSNEGDSDSEYAMSASEYLNVPQSCCGSFMPANPETAESVGSLYRVSAAGSRKVVDVPDKDTDSIPPIAIRDLQIKVPNPRIITMEWTAPGDNLDEGKVSRYDVRLSNQRMDLKENTFNQADAFAQINLDDLFDNSSVYIEAGGKVTVTVDVDDKVPVTLRPETMYFMAIRAYDDFNNTSPVSNIASFVLPSMGHKHVETSTSSTTPTKSTRPTTAKPTATSTSNRKERRNRCKKRGKIERNCKGNFKCKRKQCMNIDPSAQELQGIPCFMDLWSRYTPSECSLEDGPSDSNSKLYSAILGLRMTMSYFEDKQSSKHSRYICKVLKRLENRAMGKKTKN